MRLPTVCWLLVLRWLVYSLGSPVGMLPEQIMCVFVGYSVDNVQELLNSKEEFDIKEVGSCSCF